MKKERLAALMMAGIMSVSCAGIAMAATGTKTATLNNAKVRFNNGAVQTIQCYNIDGSNYVRARDITNNLNMGVTPIKNGKNGIMVHPYETATKTTPATLTKQSAVVKLVDGQISYDGWPHETECFLLDGSYFFKVADFEKAAEKDLSVAIEGIKIKADPSNPYGKPPAREFDYGISVEWNAAEKVMEINRTEVNLLAMFNEIRGVDKKSAVAEVDDGLAHLKEEIIGVGVLTSAPEVGEIPANILINRNTPVYKADGNVDYTNVNKAYSIIEAVFGGCNWYALGRMTEVHGEDFDRYNNFLGVGAENYVTHANSDKCRNIKGVTDPYAIEAGCVAVWKNHVAFVEYVEYDSNGKPETVYFTEANSGHTGDMKKGKYYPDFDGKVQKMSLEKFTNGRSSAFVGYVVVK